MTAAQKAAVAIGLAEWIESKEGRPNGLKVNAPERKLASFEASLLERGKKLAKDAKMAGASRGTTERVAAIKKKSEPLFQAVKSGEKTIREAQQEIEQDEEKPVAKLSPIDQLKWDAKRLREIVRAAHDLGKELAEISKTPIGIYLHLQSAQHGVDQLKAAVNAALQYAICPKCKGKKCETCKRVGWITELMNGRMPKAMQQ